MGKNIPTATEFNRRDLLKKTAAAGAIGVSGLGISGTTAADQASSSGQPSSNSPSPEGLITGSNGKVLGYETSDAKMEEPEVVTGGQARREARGAMADEYVRDIRDWFQQQGLRPNVNGAMALDITVNDDIPEAAYDEDIVNGSNPMAVMIPFVPTGQNDDEGGLLNVFMIDDGPRRVAAGALGRYVRKDNGDLSLTVVGKPDDEAQAVHKETITGGVSLLGFTECMACELTVTGICAGTYGKVGMVACTSICTGAGPAAPICGVVCGGIVAVSVAVMCYIGAHTTCRHNLDYC